MRRITLISLTLIIILASFSCQDTSPKHPTLNPDWSDITITAKGEGAPPDNAENDTQARLLACRAAKMDAYRNLAEKIYGIRVSGNTCVSEYITRGDTIASMVQGFIKKARVIETQKEDGSCEVIAEIYLGKKFVDIIMR